MAESDIRGRATRSILRSALFSWQTVVTAVAALVLFGANSADPGMMTGLLPFWQPWMWLAAGLVAEAGFVLATLTDPAETQKAVAREFEARYDLNQIKSRVSRERLERAMEYRRNMMTLVGRHGGAMRFELEQTVNDINNWIAQMHDLALHIDAFEGNRLVERDRREVPMQLQNAQKRLDIERRRADGDPRVIADLEGQVERLQTQLDNLNATANSIKRAEIQLESTLASVGTIYAQISRLGAQGVDSSSAQRLRLQIKEEIAQLDDTIHALDEVQSQSLRLS